MSNNFVAVKFEKELSLGAQFDAETASVEYTPLRRRNERASFIKEEIAKWFATVPLYESISVQSYPDHDEIRDEWFNGSITVSGPKREADFEASRGLENFKYKIVPGYINASSWMAGSSDASVQSTVQELQHRLWMMGLAVDCLNHRNQLCLEWESVENPMRKVQSLAGELKRYTDREREQIKKEQDRKAKKSA